MYFTVNIPTTLSALSTLNTANCSATVASVEARSPAKMVIKYGIADCKKTLYYSNRIRKMDVPIIYCAMLTSTVTRKSNTFQLFFQKPLKLSNHFSPISAENTTKVKESRKLSSSWTTTMPMLLETGSSAAVDRE